MVLFNGIIEHFALVPKVVNPSGRRSRKVKEYERNCEALSSRLKKI